VREKVFHFTLGGRKFSLAETRKNFETQGDENFERTKNHAVGSFKTVTG